MDIERLKIGTWWKWRDDKPYAIIIGLTEGSVNYKLYGLNYLGSSGVLFKEHFLTYYSSTCIIKAKKVLK